MSVADTGVPYTKSVSIGGHSYDVEVSRIVRQTLPVLRSSANNSNEPGEQAISYENVWPRSQHDWRLGAGQPYFDEDDGSRHRFSNSININPWSQRSITLQPQTVLLRAAGGATCKLLQVNNAIFWYKGNQIEFAFNPLTPSSTWTTVTGTMGSVGRAITASNVDVYVGGASGIYRTGTSGSMSLFSAFAVAGTVAQALAVANGRLLASADSRLVEIDSLGNYGAAGQLDFTHPRGRYWTAICEAPNGIYAGSYGSDGGDVYVFSVNPNTGGLVSTKAIEMDRGEYVTCLAAYGGVVVIGTNRGVHLANVSGDGTLVAGPLIAIKTETGSTAIPSGLQGTTAIFGRGGSMWFTWNDPRPGYYGLGRITLPKFTAPLTPAYATDLMLKASTLYANAQPNAIASGESFNPDMEQNIYFTQDLDGIYGNDVANWAASGDFRTGQITAGTTEKKTPVAFDFRCDPLPAGSSIVVELSVDGGAFSTIGTFNTTGYTGPATPVAISAAKGEDFELRFTFTRGSDPTTRPKLRRWTLRMMPSPPRVDEILIPIILHGTVSGDEMQGLDNPYDTLAEFRFLKNLEASGQVVDLVLGSTTEKVKVDQILMESERVIGGTPFAVEWNDDHTYFQGPLTLRCLTATPISSLP